MVDRLVRVRFARDDKRQELPPEIAKALAVASGMYLSGLLSVLDQHEQQTGSPVSYRELRDVVVPEANQPLSDKALSEEEALGQVVMRGIVTRVDNRFRDTADLHQETGSLPPTPGV